MEQPLGPLVSSQPAKLPERSSLVGKYTSLVPLHQDHVASLYKHLGGAHNYWRWTYMLITGYADERACQEFLEAESASNDPLFYSVMVRPDSKTSPGEAAEAAGMMSYMSMVPAQRRIEIGCIILGEPLTKSREATEAFYLMIRHAFEDLGYLRVEWKANHLNAASLAAAKRLGFTFEGIFRKHMIVKGRSRDTAWLSITDEEWPRIRQGFVTWLDESNFDEQGQQKRSLKDCRENNDATA